MRIIVVVNELIKQVTSGIIHARFPAYRCIQTRDLSKLLEYPKMAPSQRCALVIRDFSSEEILWVEVQDSISAARRGAVRAKCQYEEHPYGSFPWVAVSMEIIRDDGTCAYKYAWVRCCSY